MISWCVDRIIASSCLNSANEVDLINSQNFNLLLGNNEDQNTQKLRASIVDNSNGICSSSSSSSLSLLSSNCCVVQNEVKECRICQEEDDDINLESPCSCNDTLKFAHRKCIQKWCNKKGDITCEICSQVYTPNYCLPPPKSSPDMMAVDLRANLEIIYQINPMDPAK